MKIDSENAKVYVGLCRDISDLKMMIDRRNRSRYQEEHPT